MNLLRGWRPLLRLAWRDAARAKGRSALVLFMIALPVLAVTAADVVLQTSNISGPESLDRRLGAADARITVDPWTSRVFQGPDPETDGLMSSGQPGAVPTLEQLGAALGRPLRGIDVTVGELRVETDQGVAAVESTELDLTDRLAEGLFRIDAGRAPRGPGEVAVSHALADRGPSLGETLQIADGPALRVVGLGDSTSFRGHPLMVAPPGELGLTPADRSRPRLVESGQHTWLVDAGGPVTWDDVLALNAVGATVLSRAVLIDPPAESEIPAEVRQSRIGTDASNLAVWVLIVVMVLIEVVLLAGPAFAVGARRQSRTLALMSATGGTPQQARRTILASGVVLGGLGAALGVGLGLMVGWLVLPLAQRFSDAWFGPFDVAWWHLAGVAAFGLASALLAAVVPAWIASRQDVVAVMAGRRGDRKASLRSPLLGVVLLVAGIAGSAYGAVASGNGEIMIAVSAVVAVLGMILLVPILLAGLARVSGRLPLALRFAVRDAARHRTRTVPAVAAVAATVAGVVALGIASASDAAENRATYEPSLAVGDGIVSGVDAPDWLAIRAVLERGMPQATVTDIEGVPEGRSGPSVSLAFRTASQRNLLTSYGGSLGATVLIGDALPSVLVGVPNEDVAAADRMLATGGAVVFTQRPVPEKVARILVQRYNADGESDGGVRRVEAKAVFIEVPESIAPVQAVLSPELARSLGVRASTVAVSVTGAEITEAQEGDANEAVAALVPYGGFYVERGYQPDDRSRIMLLVLSALSGVLMLGGTLTATFLALSDARPDLATLAAVGAAPRTRRSVAGAFAIVVALVGGLLGAAVGSIPGIAVTYPLTTTGGAVVIEGSGSYYGATPPPLGPFLDIPWLLIGSLVLALPILTAIVITLAARSRLPLATRLG